MTTSTAELRANVRHLANLRSLQRDASAEVTRLYQQFERTHVKTLDRMRQLDGLVAKYEAQIREAAIDAYTTTGEKRPCPGVEVQDGTALVYQETDALEWARQHPDGRALLKLRRGDFEQIARRLDLPFVEKRPEQKARIARDLDTALAQEEA